jgi:tRNA A-37 threonylcarbamoyl transferase component Bud32
MASDPQRPAGVLKARPSRSVTLEADASGAPVVVKRFHHRGALRRALDGRRARRELGVLRELLCLGLSVPSPRALRAGRGGWELHLEPVAGARRLGEFLGSTEEPPGGWPRLLCRLARELAGLHAAGWGHGDLHAGNVLVDRAGRPWLIDFQRARRARPSAARERDDLVRAAALARESLPPRLRARFFLAWLRALPASRRMDHPARGSGRSRLAAEVEARARLHRRAAVRSGLGRWLRESSRVRSVEVAGRAALVRADLVGDDVEARELAGVGATETELCGTRRELEAAWLAAARLHEHGIPVAAPAVLVAPTRRRARDGWARFELPRRGAASEAELLARLAERGLGLGAPARGRSIARSAAGGCYFAPPFRLLDLALDP